jgi:D-sedoheptulose 7-phosphate isomerase
MKTENIINENIKTNELLKKQSKNIEKCAEIVIKKLQKGGKILLCGNGGSAADSQHIACELVAKLMKDRKALPAIALTTNTSLLTAISNDRSFDEVFSRQVSALGRKDDVLIAISTSGKSKNIVKAVEIAETMGIYTIALTGQDGNKLASVADCTIKVPSKNTQRVQEAHILIGHILCEFIESQIT